MKKAENQRRHADREDPWAAETGEGYAVNCKREIGLSRGEGVVKRERFEG